MTSAPGDRHHGATTPEPDPVDIETISTAECWRLLEESSLGRLAVTGPDGRPDVFPLNSLVHDGNLYLRTAPGRKLRSVGLEPAIAFEVDGADSVHRWSVVIKGVAERVTSEADIAASGILALRSTPRARARSVLRVVPHTITGRRLRAAPTDRSATTEQAGTASPRVGNAPAGPASDVDGLRDGKPQPIPHYAPLQDPPRPESDPSVSTSTRFRRRGR